MNRIYSLHIRHMDTITTEDLIRYVYEETSSADSRTIEAALEHDWALREKYYTLMDTYHKLDRMIESPRPEAVNAILKYAGVSAGVEKSETT